MNNQKNPVISVITTVYNTEKYVTRCFDSIMDQTYANIEFIVVDNASTGNIQEIVREYQDAYPKRTIKLVALDENVGLFHGRLRGMAAATGDYIAFIDSDDRVSLDFYRSLLMCSIENDADITACNVVLEYSDGRMSYESFAPQAIDKIDLTGDELTRTFWEQEGLCYYWHLVWNKLYRRDLINRAMPLLNLLTRKVVMCDDLAYSTVFYALGSHLVSTQMCQYYYYKRDDAYTANAPNPKIVRGNITDIISVFDFMEMIQQKCNLLKYSPFLKNWKHRMFCIWCRNVAQIDLPIYKKQSLKNYLLESFKETRFELPPETDNYFYQDQTNFIPFADYITKDLQNPDIDYISFDIFDTLILRPFIVPSDLFVLLNKRFQELQQSLLQLDFCKCRQVAEQEARKDVHNKYAYEDVTLDEIYAKLEELYCLPSHVCTEMKELEVSLEKQYCVRRNYAYEIYRQALELGKKVICISDMYLPASVIEEILNKNGYTNIEKVFVSSEYRRTKHNGTFYKAVLKELDISEKRVLHIGDNAYSDIDVPTRLGIKSIHIPKTADVWNFQSPSALSGNFFFRCFHSRTTVDSAAGLSFVGNRCVQGLVANRLYDNPFYNHNPSTDFNANPHKVGYALLGPYLLGMARWLYGHAVSGGYECIHFIARDGFLLKQVFEKVQPFLGEKQFKINYLHVSRKALMPLMIQQPGDVLGLESAINYKKQSPKKLVELLRPIIDEDVFNQAKQLCENEGFLYDGNFKEESHYLSFLRFYNKVFYNQSKIDSYRSLMKSYFSKIIGKHDCFFDIGYSGRTESLLGNLLQCQIDTFYLHLNNQSALENAQINNFKVSTFWGSSPILQGPIREMMFSSQDPSCVGFMFDGNKCHPVFEKREIPYTQKYPISYIQKGVLDFVEDFVSVFGNIIPALSFRDADLAWPLEYFFANVQPQELAVFMGTTFEDDLFLGEKVSVKDFWLRNKSNEIGNGESAFLPYTRQKWKKAIYYALFDRKTLKEKVKNKYAKHPFLLGCLKFAYSIPRALYHLVKH